MPVDYREPNINARRLGYHLRQVREILELSYDEAAVMLGRETEWLVRLETGFGTATPDQVRDVLERYGVAEHRMCPVLVDLASRPAGPLWLARHAGRMKALVRDVITMESEAAVIRTYGIAAMPELVRCEAYARLGFEHAYPDVDPGEEWDLLRSRQTHRPGGRPRVLDVILCETTLMNGPAEIRRAQIAHVLDLAEEEHTTVRVIPFSAGAHAGLHGSFDVLEFPSLNDRFSVVHTALGIDAAGCDLTGTWRQIEEVALTPGGSRTMMAGALAEL